MTAGKYNMHNKYYKKIHNLVKILKGTFHLQDLCTSW